MKRKMREKLTILGWGCFFLVIVVFILGSIWGLFPGGGILYPASMIMGVFLIVVSFVITMLSLGRDEQIWPPFLVKLFGGVLFPLLLLIAISSVIVCLPGGDAKYCVKYTIDDPHEAKLVGKIEIINPFRERIKQYDLEGIVSHKEVWFGYCFDGDALEYHLLFYKDPSLFHREVDSAITDVMNTVAKSCGRCTIFEYIGLVKKALCDKKLPYPVLYGDKFGICGSFEYLNLSAKN